MKKPRKFDDMPDAFDYCREKGSPVMVVVDGAKWKLFPSGHAVAAVGPLPMNFVEKVKA